MTDVRYSQEQWERLLEASITEIRRLATLKGGEYAGDMDRLANFRRNAVKLELLPEQVWAVYAGKHWDAVQQYCLDLGKGRERPRGESISGRLDDLIVYALLMKAMVEERESKSNPRITIAAITEAAKEYAKQLAPSPMEQYVPPAPSPSPQRPALLDPQCPGTGEAHRWARMDRWTDTCVAPGCGKMRPHERRR